MARVISDKQLELNRTLHDKEGSFGSRSDAGGLASRLHNAISRMHDAGICDSVIDYGTGKGGLVSRLSEELPSSISVLGYDPAVKAFQKKPDKPADILTCIDVLEHVEVTSIDSVLRDISELNSKFCFLIIDLQPAIKTLADGRNAHILLAPRDWWVNIISKVFPHFACFTIPHSSGFDQKLVLVASRKAEFSPFMYMFLTKLHIFDTVMCGAGVKVKDNAKK